MVEIIITAIIAIIVTAVITVLAYRNEIASVKAEAAKESEEARKETENVKSELIQLQNTHSFLVQSYEKDLANLNEKHEKEIENLKGYYETTIANLKEAQEKEVKGLKDSHARIDSERNAFIEQQRADASSRLADSEKKWELRLERLKEEMLNLNNQLLANKQESLREANQSQISELLKPVREQFEAFRKSVDETRTAGEVTKEELKKSFENTLNLFAQQQQHSVAALREQTDRIGNDAANLVRVLRHDSKAQGDWGEMILETLLESSGLQRDTHYFVQENVQDDERRNFRPDVVVRFPEGRSVIIDSKVSLTAYADAFDTDNEANRKLKLREHARSVRKHIDELAAKKYDTLVTDAIGLVLMFIPNDQCYLSAIEQEKDLTRYAYSKGIVLISPSNLMIALQLAFNLWQQDRQTKNVETIVKTATDLYEKTAMFSETLADIETHISRLSAAFGKAKTQLFDGKGNIFRRIENLKELGITPKKQIKGLD